jgi:general secretion pathway protein B
MSYILEALKKAQAERALGSAPTIHTLPLHPVADSAARTGSATIWVGLAAGLLIAAAVGLVWRAQEPVPPAAQSVTAAPADAAPLVPAGAAGEPNRPAAAPASAAVTPPLATAPAAAPVPQRAAVSQPAIAAPVPAPVPPRATTRPDSVVPQLVPAPPAGRPAAPEMAPQLPPAARSPAAAAPAVKAVSSALAIAAPAAPSKPAPAAPDDNVPPLRELPEAVAREIPQVKLGGYIYSSDPAERLLLVDNVLRHEGETLAPGLVLEKLLPKAALMNYKGYRYKIPYR